MGDNICGPSVLRVPEWVTAPLDRYYLYFADHRGSHIRLAVASRPQGPWRTCPAGCLDLADSLFCTSPPTPAVAPPYWQLPGDGWRAFLYPHIASPDVHIDHERRQLRMYFHGLLPDGDQLTRVATSDDGLKFHVLPDLVAPPYLRAFRRDHAWYGIAMPNLLLRSPDGLAAFEIGGELLPASTRHAGLLAHADTLHLFWTQLHEAPERIHYGRVSLCDDWRAWKLSGQCELMRPALPWEGADVAPVAAAWGAGEGLRNELRDPYPFLDEAGLFLFYVGGGERGIGIATLALT